MNTGSFYGSARCETVSWLPSGGYSSCTVRAWYGAYIEWDIYNRKSHIQSLPFQRSVINRVPTPYFT